MGFLFNPYFTMRNGLSISKISAKFQGSVDRAGDADSVNIKGNFRYDTLKRELQQRSLQHEFAGMLECSLKFALQCAKMTKFQRSPPVGFFFDPLITIRNGPTISKISAKFQGRLRTVYFQPPL